MVPTPICGMRILVRLLGVKLGRRFKHFRGGADAVAGESTLTDVVCSGRWENSLLMWPGVVLRRNYGLSCA